MESRLSVGRVRELFHYDPDTGILCWSMRPNVRGGQIRVGDPAGTVREDGYVRVSINRVQYYAHHLIWVWMTGEWPESDIDHQDRIRNNNRWANIRLATKTQNNANILMHIRNKSGIKGVHRGQYGSGWVAQICVNNRRIYLGTFFTKEEAAAAYAVAAQQHFGVFARAI